MHSTINVKIRSVMFELVPMPMTRTRTMNSNVLAVFETTNRLSMTMTMNLALANTTTDALLGWTHVCDRVDISIYSESLGGGSLP
jgi:hypothetical protein